MQGADALDGTAVAILDGWVDSLQHMLTMTYHIFWSQVGLCGALPAQGVLRAQQDRTLTLVRSGARTAVRPPARSLGALGTHGSRDGRGPVLQVASDQYRNIGLWVPPGTLGTHWYSGYPRP